MLISIKPDFSVAEAVRTGYASSRPLHLRRHRRQDRFDIAAGLQAKNGAAVVEQVELDISSASDQLFLAILRAPRRLEIAPHQLGIDVQKGAAELLGESEIGIPVAGIVMVIENAADPARLVAMRQVEIGATAAFASQAAFIAA